MPAWLALLRPHQWVKNLLVLVALATSHRWNQADAVAAAVILGLAFCLVASAVYAVNDVLDRHADALHPSKRARPVARGVLTPGFALALAAVLAVAGFALGALTGRAALLTLIVYALLSLAYCLWLKRLLWVDVIALACLYVLRVVAGAYAIAVSPSTWLLAFAGFVFASLASAKRYADLQSFSGDVLPGRAYRREDAGLVAAIGSACGVVAVLVLALYANSPEVRALYTHPQWIWLLCPLLLYWLARLWILAGRGTLHADPILFALRDPPSWLVAFAFIVLLALAL